MHIVKFIAPYLMDFVSLLFIVNPLNAAVLYIDLTQGISPSRKKKIALSTAIATLTILLIFGLAGKLIFELFGFTLAAFQIAGGILIFNTARGMTQARVPSEKHNPEETKPAMSLPDISIVPLAIPILAGPGAITTVMLTMGEKTAFFIEFPIQLVTLALLSTIIYFSLTHSDRLLHKLGQNTMNVFTRIMGIAMMALSVQYILNGVAKFLQQLHLHAFSAPALFNYFG